MAPICLGLRIKLRFRLQVLQENYKRSQLALPLLDQREETKLVMSGLIPAASSSLQEGNWATMPGYRLPRAPIGNRIAKGGPSLDIASRVTAGSLL